jgi:mannosyltransferase OCH1-like enzyme
MREEIYKVIKQIWEEEEMPNKWRVCILHPRHKKGDKTE